MAGYDGRHKLFVGSLPPDIGREDVETVFSTYGKTTDIHIMSGSKSNSGQACAFIVYDSRDSAEVAIASLDGVYSFREETEPIRVSWAKPGSGGGPGGGGGGPGGGGGGRGQLPVMAAQLGGGVTAPLRFPTPVIQTPAFRGGPVGGPVGGGFNAVAPPRQLAGGGPPLVPIMTAAAGGGAFRGGGPVRVSPHLNFGPANAGGGAVPPPPPPDPAITRHRTKLFVGNLPNDISQEAINTVFSHYGTVTNIHIMNGKSKSGQSCAFVEYSAPIEAETAVLTLHEKYEIRPGDGVILVKYANANAAPRAAPY